MRKIRELGSLPSDAFDKYQGLTLSQVNNHVALFPCIVRGVLRNATIRGCQIIIMLGISSVEILFMVLSQYACAVSPNDHKFTNVFIKCGLKISYYLYYYLKHIHDF